MPLQILILSIKSNVSFLKCAKKFSGRPCLYPAKQTLNDVFRQSVQEWRKRMKYPVKHNDPNTLFGMCVCVHKYLRGIFWPVILGPERKKKPDETFEANSKNANTTSRCIGNSNISRVPFVRTCMQPGFEVN